MSDKVVTFPGAEPLPENPIQVVEHPDRLLRYCHHLRITLEEHDRTVLCVDCGATLDPFNFLVHQGRLIQQAWDTHRQVKHKLEEQHARLSELQKEEKRTKDRIRRLKEKEPVIDVRGKDRL